jgi:hypothetical protein
MFLLNVKYQHGGHTKIDFLFLFMDESLELGVWSLLIVGFLWFS